MNYLYRLFRWYFTIAPLAQLRFIANSLTIIDDTIGLSTNVHFFFTPIFGDTTIIGRILTLIIRSVIIVFGAVIFVILALILFAIPLLWLSVVITWALFPLVGLIPLAGIVYYILSAQYKPERILPYKHPLNAALIPDFANYKAKLLLNAYGDPQFYNRTLKDGNILHFVQRSGIPLPEILQLLATLPFEPYESFIQNLEGVIYANKVRYIRTVHLFGALLNSKARYIEEFLKHNNLDITMVNKYLSWEEYEYGIRHTPEVWDEDYHVYTGGGVNRTWQGTVTPTLNQFSEDISLSVRGDRYKVVRQYLIDDIEQNLQKSINSNVLLMGAIGSGKDTLVREIAQAINAGATSGSLWSKRIVALDIGRLLGGTSEKGSFEQRVEAIIDEIMRSKNIILYINDFKTALQTKTAQGISLFALLQNSIARSRLHIIGSMTSAEYRALEESDPGFLKQFALIKVPETDEEETTHILHNQSLAFEETFGLFFPFHTIDGIYKASNEYFNDTSQPKKGLNLLEDVALFTKKMRTVEKSFTKYGDRIVVTMDLVNQVITQKTDIPAGIATTNEVQKLLNLENEFQNYIVDQTEAVHAVAEVLRRNRSGLRSKDKPIGTFLFVGPTGVGKTELAKTLARIYYGGEKHMIRLDMSEYQNQDSLERLIGSSAGDQTTSLTQLVAKQPFSIILLDELEKAHPKILDVFLQVLDDSRLTDANGTTISFNQTIIIATSNAATAEITAQFRDLTSEDQYEQIEKEIYHLLSPYFRIEFLNRFDQIIVFKPLTQKSVEKIIGMQLTAIAKKMYEDRKIKITFTPQTMQTLIQNGYNKELGARPLQREIQNTVESKLALLLLSGKVTDGESISI